MKIEWTTIESGAEKTKSRIDTILENKNRISVFFADNKKHLFGAGVSTMAMAFVVGFANISGTEFSANVMFPTLSSEIEEINGEEGEVLNEENLLGDLDLSFEDFETGTGEIEISEDGNQESLFLENEIESEEILPETDETEDLINDLFGLSEISDEEINSEEILPETETFSLIQETEKIEEKSESENISNFLEDNFGEENEILHGSAGVQEVEEIKKEPENKNIFKQNFHTIDMNLVQQKAMLKDIEVVEENLHGSAEYFEKSESLGINFSSSSEDLQQNQTDYVVQNTKQLSQSGPADMLFGLGFLSLILAYFFRRKKA